MKASFDYQGMRWFKCDLHMHTPADARHWRGESMGSNPTESARRFVRRCYQERLECIAVTEHNFIAKAFLVQLRNAIKELKSEFGYEIVLFPGFEITADVGRGMHVLALFEPGADLNEIDHILTKCGVPMPRQKPDGSFLPSEKRLFDIISEVQKCDENGDLKGIVICPHPYETGIFDNDRISEWLQQQEWKNPELFCVEVPKPLDQLSQGWQRLFRNGDNCHSDWKRVRPMAALMSSDAKALSAQEDPNNYIGKRFSWIKMSWPSIEALRQAFLDPESRICLDREPPRVDHTHIRSIRVAGSKFLQNQTVSLSPHLNCLIGGRGSGKSLLFESLRLGLRGEMLFKDADEKDHVAAKQIKRLRGTFTSHTKIELDVFHKGLQDRFVVDDSGQPARINCRVVQDPPTVFRSLNALLFSQEEITQLADLQKSLLEFIDGLAADRLEAHRSMAWQTIDRLKAARQVDETIRRIDGELVVLKQETAELARQLAAKAQVQEELKRHRAAQEAQRYLDSVSTKVQETNERLKDIAEELEAEPPPLGSRVETFPENTFFKQTEEKTGAAYRDLAAALRSAGDTFRNNIELALSQNPDWKKVHAAIQAAEERFKAACSEKGLTPQEAEQLRETELQHRTRQAALQTKQAERENVEKQRPDMASLLEKLAGCWKKETDTRREILDVIVSSTTMPRTSIGSPILKVSLTFAGDRKTFLTAWRELAPDRRTAAGRAWDRYARDEGGENIGDQLFDAFQKALALQSSSKDVLSQTSLKKVSERYEKETVSGSPVQWLELNLKSPKKLPPLVRQYLDEIKKVREERADKWFELMLTRVSDAADLTLLRNDGSEAGSFQKGDLSTGQKNTAILSLLLAHGNGPVLIDQPEDELDSEFLFRELVPMFRKTKVQRQMIIVTHNANIPVNADAEFVYTLEAKGGRGVCRAQGGIDRPEVTMAVLDIMEGSKEAFLRRKEKYHF
jgi:ABC-type cobalamin/Fe3+-siderophores transport system ATPase subunit